MSGWSFPEDDVLKWKDETRQKAEEKARLDAKLKSKPDPAPSGPSGPQPPSSTFAPWQPSTRGPVTRDEILKLIRSPVRKLAEGAAKPSPAPASLAPAPAAPAAPRAEPAPADAAIATEIARLSEKARAAEAESARLRSELEDGRRDADRVRAELASERATASRLRDEAGLERGSAERSRSELEELRRAREELETRLREGQAGGGERLRVAEERLRAASAESAGLRERVSSLQSQLELSRQADQDRLRLAKDLDEATQTHRDMKLGIEAAQANAAALNERLAKAGEELAKATEALERERGARGASDSDRAEGARRLEEAEKRLAEAKGQRDELEREASLLRKAREEAERETNELRRARETLQAELETLKAAFEREKSELSARLADAEKTALSGEEDARFRLAVEAEVRRVADVLEEEYGRRQRELEERFDAHVRRATKDMAEFIESLGGEAPAAPAAR